MKYPWTHTEDNLPPSDELVVAAYRDEAGHWRQVMASYIQKNTTVPPPECELGDYDEFQDEFYLPEGWYERIIGCDDFSYLEIGQTVTHWMHLPTNPIET